MQWGFGIHVLSVRVVCQAQTLVKKVLVAQVLSVHGVCQQLGLTYKDHELQ